jgi:hypothetical protein
LNKLPKNYQIDINSRPPSVSLDKELHHFIVSFKQTKKVIIFYR